MSFSELFEHLDPTVAEPLAKAFERLRSELRSEMGVVAEEEQKAEAAPQPAAEAAVEAPSPADEAAALGPDPLEELKHAVVRVDAAGTQAEILSALLEGARRFSSRAALLLVRDDELHVWDAHGFESAAERARALRIRPEPSSPWHDARDGAGVIPLTPGECAVLTEAAGVASPALGVLVPMMLGSRVAALLYADRADAPFEPPLGLSALQLLTFSAGGVLETLPVRSRDATASLSLHAPAEALEAAPAAVPEPVPEPVEEAVEPTPAVPEPVEEAVEPTPAMPEPVEEAIEPAPAEPEPVEEAVEPAPAMPEPVEEAVEPPPAEPEPVEEPGPAEEEIGTEARPEVDTVGEVPAEEAPPEAEPEPAPPMAAGFGEELDLTPPAGIPTIPMEPPTEPEEAVPSVGEVTPEPAPEIPVEAPVEAASETSSVAELTEELPSPPEPVEPAPPPAAEEEAQGSAAERATTVVSPPGDLEGPGWAFTRTPSASSTEAQREEARRLARLLVTEIKLYNESQVQLGRQNSDLYTRLQEDIDRSRQIFEDRVEDEIRGDEDYFHDALVRILAGGDETALGQS